MAQRRVADEDDLWVRGKLVCRELIAPFPTEPTYYTGGPFVVNGVNVAGRIGTLSADVGALQSDMLTAQGDINTAQADILTNTADIGTTATIVAAHELELGTLTVSASVSDPFFDIENTVVNGFYSCDCACLAGYGRVVAAPFPTFAGNVRLYDGAVTGSLVETASFVPTVNDVPFVKFVPNYIGLDAVAHELLIVSYPNSVEVYTVVPGAGVDVVALAYTIPFIMGVQFAAEYSPSSSRIVVYGMSGVGVQVEEIWIDAVGVWQNAILGVYAGYGAAGTHMRCYWVADAYATAGYVGVVTLADVSGNLINGIVGGSTTPQPGFIYDAGPGAIMYNNPWGDATNVNAMRIGYVNTTLVCLAHYNTHGIRLWTIDTSGTLITNYGFTDTTGTYVCNTTNDISMPLLDSLSSRYVVCVTPAGMGQLEAVDVTTWAAPVLLSTHPTGGTGMFFTTCPSGRKMWLTKSSGLSQWITVPTASFANIVVGTPGGCSDTILCANGNAVVNGDLTVLGTTVTLNVANLNVADKVITCNFGEAGAGVGGTGLAGLEADRGTLPNYAVTFNETLDRWGVGAVGAEQPILTRDETANMANNTVPHWDSGNNRVVTATAVGSDLYLGQNCYVGTTVSGGNQTQLHLPLTAESKTSNAFADDLSIGSTTDGHPHGMTLWTPANQLFRMHIGTTGFPQHAWWVYNTFNGQHEWGALNVPIMRLNPLLAGVQQFYGSKLIAFEDTTAGHPVSYVPGARIMTGNLPALGVWVALDTGIPRTGTTPAHVEMMVDEFANPLFPQWMGPNQWNTGILAQAHYYTWWLTISNYAGVFRYTLNLFTGGASPAVPAGDQVAGKPYRAYIYFSA